MGPLEAEAQSIASIEHQDLRVTIKTRSKQASREWAG
jgi:hypothetical protein